MMGGGPEKDKKFINKIFKQIVAGSTELKVVGDKLGTPTYTVAFARGLRIVAGTDLFGVYNQVCEGDCSRYDVAVEFVRLLGLENRVKVTQVSSDFFKREYFALKACLGKAGEYETPCPWVQAHAALARCAGRVRKRIQSRSASALGVWSYSVWISGLAWLSTQANGPAADGVSA